LALPKARPCAAGAAETAGNPPPASPYMPAAAVPRNARRVTPPNDSMHPLHPKGALNATTQQAANRQLLAQGPAHVLADVRLRPGRRPHIQDRLVPCMARPVDPLERLRPQGLLG